MKLLSPTAIFQLALTAITFLGASSEARAFSGTPFCFGDGTGTACPCSNTGAALGHGCANSTVTWTSGAGAVLTGAGLEIAGAGDTLVLTVSNVTGPGIFLSATGVLGGGNGMPLFDGLLCAGIGIQRFGIKFPNISGVASYPTGNDPLIHTITLAQPGDIRYFQFWYRDTSLTWACAPPDNLSNFTNGLIVTWTL